MMAGLLAFTIYKLRDRPFRFCRRYGPLICISFATVFIVADPIRHVLMDHGDLPPFFAQYRCAEENLSCLSPGGALFTFFTYFGFFLLMVGTLWNANFMDKVKAIRQKWKTLRTGVNSDDQDSMTEPLFSDSQPQYGTGDTSDQMTVVTVKPGEAL